MGYFTKTLGITITLENSVLKKKEKEKKGKFCTEAKKKKKGILNVSLMIYSNTTENEEK